jgi:pyruvate/2-oxoglutarate dehydrogenase complex dihydrolipoamide dehydrogenase (E3) component
VDEHLRTRVPTILGCGDVAGPYQFTHVAAHQAWYAAVNGLFDGLKQFKADYRVIPWCTFVDPEVARVGLNVQEARERGIAFELTRFELGELDRVIADRGAAASAGHGVDPTWDHGVDHGVHHDADGWVQVLTVPGKDRILGATIVGRHAGDLLAEFVLAMKHGLGLNKILGTIHTYPTLSEAAKYAAGEWKRAHVPQGLLRWAERFHGWRRGP